MEGAEGNSSLWRKALGVGREEEAIRGLEYSQQWREEAMMFSYGQGAHGRQGKDEHVWSLLS